MVEDSEAQELGNTRHEKMDAVDALSAFIDNECKIVIGLGVFVRKDEFAQRYAKYCEQLQVEPPSPETLGSILTSCYRSVWSDTHRGDGGQIPVWRNLAFRTHGQGGALP